MPETLTWMQAAAAVLVGLLLGAVYFGGLWWTVRRGLSARRPALLFGVSLLLRMTIAMAGIYWVGREIGPASGRATWQALLLCLLGLVLARPLVLWLTRQPARSTTEAGHAS
jgi:F1F0 ATPase subunit 2